MIGINQSKNSIIEFIKLSGDNFTVRNPLLEEPPIVLVPVNITRRRRTNAEEIGKSNCYCVSLWIIVYI